MALLNHPSAMLLGLMTASALVTLARLPFGRVLRRLGVLLGFLALLWLVLPITAGGDAVTRLWGVPIGERGLVLAAGISIKSIAILLGLMAMVATMPVATLGHAMGQLKVPPKIVYLLLMTYRYIYVIEVEYRRLVEAIKIRGFMPRQRLHTYRTVAYLVGMLLVRAALRADRVHHAMVCRGFRGRFYTIRSFSMDRASAAFLIVVCGVVLLMGVMEWGALTDWPWPRVR
jgi:cobalt/nickel transport system permease protein